mmetsp:Transcript_28652/g.75561  ORF Transcript_28652/g.75561 Transcript_28652/m.75561 type:complete len:302 (-) Transcript_28652:1802-2707(-)
MTAIFFMSELTLIAASISYTTVGSVRPLTATLSTGRKTRRRAVRSSAATVSLANAWVLYRELRLFKRAVRFTPSPKRPYFMRRMEPTLPASTFAECTPHRHITGFPSKDKSKPSTSLVMSSADLAERRVWFFRDIGALKTARTSSPMNSSSVPPSLSTMLPIVLNTVSSNERMSLGVMSEQAPSKPAMSQKSTEHKHLLTPMRASTPAVKRHWTTHGGTYFVQDLTEVRICLKAHSRLATSAAVPSLSVSASMYTSCKEVNAFMSSTRPLNGCKSVLVNFVMVTLKENSHAERHPTTNNVM